MSIVVSDTSPIRALAHLDHLRLLEGLFGEVLIPPTVVRELEQPRLRFKPVVVSGLSFVRFKRQRTERWSMNSCSALGQARLKLWRWR